ncbi:MAG: DUF378 domain-containing protein [Rickettsiales bacterium]|nr:DUF378 domain-containing protein [Rickettsiales bacterium]
MKLFHIFTLILVLLGGINWGLVGLIDMNLITTLFGTGGLTTLVYVLVTVASCYHIFPMIMKHFEVTG